jgi:hypothetical protein
MARSLHPSFVTSLVFAAMGTGCVPPLDNQSTVHDVRILAITADPPEITYAVQGAIPTNSTPTCQPDVAQLAGPGVVAVRALVTDPNGAGRPLHYLFTVCPQTSTERCPDAGAYVIAEGDAPAPEITVSWDLGGMLTQEVVAQEACQISPASCVNTPLLTAFAQNPLGLCRYGVWLQVALSVTAPDGEFDDGATLAVFTPVPSDYPSDPSVCPQGPDGGPPPHHNPQLEALWLDGQALPQDSMVTVSGYGTHDVIPVPPSNGMVDYCVPTFSGGWERITESWLYEMMTTAGSFDRQQAGELAPLIGTSTDGGPILYTFIWTPLMDGGFPPVATLYEVTRDGRGGTSWISAEVGLSQ